MVRDLRSMILTSMSVLALSTMALLSGCTTIGFPAGPITAPPSSSFSGVAFHGVVKAAVLPISGAQVQLYAAGMTGNASVPTPLLTPPLTTDRNGAFSIPRGYVCPFSNSVLYLVAQGGTVVAATQNSPNQNIALLTVVGPCNGLAASSSFTVNEVTTVASAYAMAPFMTVAPQIGAAASNSQGVINAASTVASIVNLAAGTLPGSGFPATGSLPVQRINALANAIDACVTANSNCVQFYSAASASGAAPTNTLDAVSEIVHHPGLQVTGVFTATKNSQAYAPALSAAPADWTLPITFSGGGLSVPTSIAADSKGNLWVANYFNVASLFSNTGVPVFPAGITGDGLFHSFGLAVDAKDQAWITNEESAAGTNNGLGSMTVLGVTGNTVSTVQRFSAGALDYPIADFVDTTGTVWIVNSGSHTVTLLDASGNPLSGSTGYGTSIFATPVAVRVDSEHYGYIADQSTGDVYRVAPDGSSIKAISCCSGPTGLAIDAQNNVWIANFAASTVSQINNGSAVVSSGYTGLALNHPQAVATDGTGNVWIANDLGRSLAELSGAQSASTGSMLSPAQGYGTDAGLVQPYSLAIDSSGSIWITNLGANTITEFIGLAAPVTLPLVGVATAPR